VARLQAAKRNFMNWMTRLGDWFAGLLGRREPAAEPEYIWRPAPPPSAEGFAPERPAPAGQPAAPRFETSSADHRHTEEFASIRARLRTAYTPAQPVTDRRNFSGRTRVMAQVIRAIEDQRLHAVIYGERGLGKTSMLHVLAQTARDARYLVVYITCSAGSTFEEMFRALCAAIPVMYHEGYGPTSPEGEAGLSLADVLGDAPITNRAASDLLARVVGTRVLVVLDEFDRAGSDDFRRAIAELIKSLSDRAARVQLLIAGVAANLTELVANVPSIQRNIFALQVPKMTPAEIRDLVKHGESICGMTFDDAAVEAINDRALGFPFLATLLSHRSALVAIDHERTMATASDVAEATGEVVDEFRGRISRRAQTQIDQAVARGMLAPLGVLAGAGLTSGGWFTVGDFMPVHGEARAIDQAAKTAQTLGEQQMMLESRQDAFGPSWHFAEESVPPYIWLLSFRGAEMDESGPLRSAAL
jgi:Cdc6-like AAA superfamily ATPase